MATTYYRTRDGRADYGFSFERRDDGSWRAYITSMPGYGLRNTGSAATHRSEAGGRYYICWSQPLHSEAEAREVAKLWADATQEYIKTGRTIDEQMRSRH